jgi:hypothetical protein
MRYVLVLLLATACSPLYVPNTRNVPLFKEGGEFQASVFGTTAGGDAQLAYAVSDHVAAIGSYSFGSKKETNPGDGTPFTRKNSYGEIGLGYYKVKRNSRWELFAGYGAGKGTSHDQYYFYGLNNDVVATGTFNKIFIQPSIGTNNRKFNIAFTPRFGMVKFTEFVTSVKTVKPDEKYQPFIEPAITGKFHLAGNLHGIFQLGLAVPFKGDQVYFAYMPTQFAVGIQIDTSNRLRTRVYK